MSRYRRRRDANHAEIADALRRLGWYVLDASTVGPNAIAGFPDLVAVWPHTEPATVVLVEVKRPGHRGDLTTDERLFHALWPGALEVVCDVDDCAAMTDKYAAWRIAA